jgi:membrane protease YdiL (CAAX protease family)
VLSFFGGLIFAWRYLRTNSFWAVALEHALYGNLIFTIGLGVYFFTGISSL